MSDKVTLNLNLLLEVRITNKRVCKKINWLPAKNTFWVKRKEGFYFDGNYDGPYTKEQLESGKLLNINFIVDGVTVSYPPFGQLFFSGRQASIGFDFETYEKAMEWEIKMIEHIPNGKRFVTNIQ
jgi:hypothetical protein